MQVSRVAVDGGAVMPVTSGDRVHTSFTLSKDGARMAVGIQDPSAPPEVYLTPTSEYRPVRLTRTNPLLDSLSLGAIEPVRWKSRDGKEIEGVLLKPVGYQPGTRYPVLTYVHGGPSGVFTLGFEPQFGSAPFPLQAGPYPIQVFAGLGYAVFMPNPRGSSGYGKEFLRANIPNLFSLRGATDIPSALSEEYFGALRWKDKEVYQRSSAIYFAENIRTPTLIQHGERDDRVQLSQAWELYRALEANDVPRLFVVYPRQGHLVLEPKQQKDMLRRNLDWFTKWIRERPRP
jgi:dipeptidyl aminopeptidase/acylaminoacyl peptidase